MFDLQYRRAYHWYDIFIILSWVRFDPYLVELQFPLSSDSLFIRQTALNFIKHFYEIRWEIYKSNKLSDEGQLLFDATYRELAAAIGEAKTKIFCEWGNQLHIDRRLEFSLELILRTMRLLINEQELYSQINLTSLSTKTQQQLQLLLKTYIEEARNIGNSLDLLDEEMSHDDWGKIILDQYKNPDFADRTKDETPVSPVDALAVWIYSFKEKLLFRSIKVSLSQQELKILNSLLQSHPNWIKAQSKSPSIYLQPLDLLELMSQV